jgi:hypothetical protein
MPWHDPTLYIDVVFRVTPWHDLNPGKQKSPVLSHQGFFFVDKRFEISNLDLIRDMQNFIKLMSILLL